MKSQSKHRSTGEIAKSALGGLATFGTESGRLLGRGAKATWAGARRFGSKAKKKAADKRAELVAASD